MPLAGNPVMMNIPDGFYDITVSRTGGVRCDVYAGDMQIINNTTSSGSQNRPSESAVMKAPAMALSGGGLDLTIGNTSGSNERISGVVREYSIAAVKEYITVCGAVSKKVTMSYDGTAVTVHSNGGGIKNAVLSAVNYSGDGSLKSIKLYDIDLSSGECRKDIEAEDGTVLYLWNSVSEMIPEQKKRGR